MPKKNQESNLCGRCGHALELHALERIPRTPQVFGSMVLCCKMCMADKEDAKFCGTISF